MSLSQAMGVAPAAKTQRVRPGDFVLIEPSMPHHFDAVPGTELVYVVYKHKV